jgi:lysophospholipase L1-like esterase
MKHLLSIAIVVALSGVAVPGQEPAASCPDMARALQDLVRADTRARDFAELHRFQDDNRTIKAGDSRVVRVVFMGDSITDLWRQPQFGGFFPGKPYVDRGISGQTTPQMLVRFRQDVIALRPETVVILAGTNDISGNTGPESDEEIEGYLTSMCELAQANGIRVVLASILPVSDYHRRPPNPPMTTRRPPQRIAVLNSWIRDYASSHHHVYLDYFSATVDSTGMLREEFSEDDLHPNAKGYAAMAPLAEAAVQKALAAPAPGR